MHYYHDDVVHNRARMYIVLGIPQVMVCVMKKKLDILVVDIFWCTIRRLICSEFFFFYFKIKVNSIYLFFRREKNGKMNALQSFNNSHHTKIVKYSL